MTEPATDAYSQVADRQLDTLQASDRRLYEAVMGVCEFIFDTPGRAQAMSAAIQTGHGIVFRLPVTGYGDYKVFWAHTVDGPRVEAVFPHPA